MTRIARQLLLNKERKILVFGEGAIAGAFSAGFVYWLVKKDKLKYFDQIYCYSVGVYLATFGVAGQADTIKNVWLNKVDGYKLINPFNLLTFGIRNPLRLEYLENLFSSGVEKLDVGKVFSSKVQIKYALMDYYTGSVEFISPNKKFILKQMSAACAVPFIHRSVKIEDKKYLDPTFVYGTTPYIERIVNLGDKIVYVSNLPTGYYKYKNSKGNMFLSSIIFEFIGKFYPSSLQKIFKERKNFIKKAKEYLAQEKKIQIIQPEKLYLQSARDTNKARIENLFQDGIMGAKKFLASREGAAEGGVGGIPPERSGGGQ
jgi:predicted patatin/cPLA2 family phospholipase